MEQERTFTLDGEPIPNMDGVFVEKLIRKGGSELIRITNRAVATTTAFRLKELFDQLAEGIHTLRYTIDGNELFNTSTENLRISYSISDRYVGDANGLSETLMIELREDT